MNNFRWFLCFIGKHKRIMWTPERCKKERVMGGIMSPWDCFFCEYQSERFKYPVWPRRPKGNINENII